MSTPGDFETADGDSPEPDGTNPKYYQVAVPNFPFGGTSPDPALGSSFVRLGSFPALTAAIPGLQNSVTLAKMVGDSEAIGAEDLGAEVDGSLNKYPGKFLVGFADDTRNRRTGDLTKQKRQAETKNLLTKGGWWDHADGNRITTTTGDKIEVIQGNYKMVVLGRQTVTATTKGDDVAGEAFITDVSGGFFEEQNMCPTPCIKTVEYTLSDKEWTLFQDNGKGKVVTRFEGRQIDYFVGSKKEAYIGQDFEKGSASGDLLPEVISKTWAKKIETYVGSSDKLVPSIYSCTYAESIQSDTIANTVTSTTTAPTVTNVTTAVLISSFNHAINNFTFTFGIQESLNLGAIFDVQLGPKSSVNVAKWQFNGTENVVAGENTKATALETRLSAIDKLIVATKDELAGKVTDVSGDLIALSTKAVKLGVTYTAIFSQINLV